MTGSLCGRVAIVTGGASGIGAATVRALAGEGAHVVIADVADGGALEAEVAQARYVSLDVSDESGWAALVADCNARYSRIDILVNNAGLLLNAPLIETSRADFDRIFAVNVTGVHLGMAAVAPIMIAQGKGAIVNTSSTGGYRVTSGSGAYSASKFAVRGLTKAAALELGPHGIRVNSVHPGWIDTPLTNKHGAPRAALDTYAADLPLKRVGTPEDVAAAILFLASDAAAYCSGTELLVDGGHMTGRYVPAQR